MCDLILRERITATASEDFKKNRIIGARYIDKTPLLAALLSTDHETTFLYGEVRRVVPGIHFHLQYPGTLRSYGKC